MPSTEIIKRGKNRYYYRAKSVREGTRVRKERKYLGKNLTAAALRVKERDADTYLDTALNSLLTTQQHRQLKTIANVHRDVFTRPDVYEWFISEFTYHSDAIEGNTLTLKETALLLFDEIAPAGKHPREIFETINHKKAIEYLLSYRGKLNKKFVCALQAIVTENTLRHDLETQRGAYRSIQVFIRGADFLPPPPKDVAGEMRKLLAWYNRNKNVHPVIAAAYFHSGFESIHPFVDGNGRVGRLLMNWMLLRHQFPMITIRVQERFAYYEALEKGRRGNLKPLLTMLLRHVLDMGQQLKTR